MPDEQTNHKSPYRIRTRRNNRKFKENDKKIKNLHEIEAENRMMRGEDGRDHVPELLKRAPWSLDL